MKSLKNYTKNCHHQFQCTKPYIYICKDVLTFIFFIIFGGFDTFSTKIDLHFPQQASA